jgi:hypothetical protein
LRNSLRKNTHLKKIRKLKFSEFMSEIEKIKKGMCPSCDGKLVFQEGCKVCYGCGWGGCS